MSKYISVEWLEENEPMFESGADEQWFRVAINSAPSIDICFCRECKYAHMTYGGECKYCDIWELEDPLYLDGDFFCAFGERKNDE